ncbi:DnaJ sub B member 5 [Tyrophagus putrescentiae]|nr:DnaJ sub B member 5 [Tyrophagus putrescentiae]
MPSESVVGEEAHCRALGVPVDATLEQIKAAYRKEALRNHPDKNPGSKAAAATENFMRVKAAYDYLLRVRSAGSVGGGSVATRTAATDFTTGDTSNTSTSNTSNTSTWNTSNTSSSSSFSTFSTAPPNGQPPIRHDLLLTLEEYLHGTVKKLLISPPPTSPQQQKKLLEVRVQAGATPGTVLYGRILSIGLFTFSAQAGGVLPEDRSIAVVLGDRPHPKFSRYPWPGSPNLKVVYQLTEAEVRRAVANNTTYSRRSITLVLAIPTLGVNTATPGPFISHRIMLHQLQTPPPVCITLNYQGLLMAPGSALRGYLYVELKPPPGHTFESLIAAAMSATRTTTPPPAPEPPSTPFRNSTNKTQQQQQQKTPSRAKSKVAKQPKPPKQPIRQSKRILKKNQPAPPPPSPPSPTSQPPSSPPTPPPEPQQPPPPPPPPPSSSSSSPEVITIDSPTVDPVRHTSPDVSTMLSCAYCARRFLYRRILIEHERKHRCIYTTCTFSSDATPDVAKHILGCSKGQ